MKKFILLSLFIYSNVWAEKTAQLGYDLNLIVNIDTPPALSAQSSLNYEISASRYVVENIKIEVAASNGIAIKKDGYYKNLGLVQPEIPLIGRISFKVNQAGEHKITLKVTGNIEGGRYTDRYEYIYFTTSENSFENRMGWNNDQREYTSVILNSQHKNIYQQDVNGFIEIAAADKNLNMITAKVKESDFYNPQKGQTGMVTITGTYIMRNRQDDDVYIHKNSLVELLHGVSGEHLEWTYTDSFGAFTFPEITNPGSDGVFIRIFAVRFLANGLGHGVCYANGCVDNAASDGVNWAQFHYELSPYITNLNDGLVNIGLLQSPFSLETSLRAMWIKHDMDKAYAHLSIISSVRGPFTAEWKNNGTIGNFYEIGANIHFKEDVANGTNHTVLHELGHNVMYNAGTFPVTPTDCPNPHYVDKVSGTQCAWTEGWASAFANMVNDDPSRCFAPSTTNCISYEVDPSFNECFPDWDCGLNAHQVEGHVTGALWDLYDVDEDGLDINAYGANEIYDTMELSAYPSFLSWWSAWLAQGFPTEATNSLFQNAIEFTQSYDIEMYRIYHSSNFDPEEGQAIAITTRGRNLGDVTTVGTPVTLYRSFIPVFNGFEPAVQSYDYGEIVKDELFTPYFYFLEPNSGTIYYRACYADQHGLDEDNSNNCSDIISIEVMRPDEMFFDGFE